MVDVDETDDAAVLLRRGQRLDQKCCRTGPMRGPTDSHQQEECSERAAHNLVDM